MPKQSPAAASWDGAPPVSEDGFTFVHGELFAESSGQNRHRRATVAELKALVAAGSDKDKPAHWFEAQLVHYGLKPSKTKAVARMRLFDAVNAGNLGVPQSISSLEAKLKKEWTKNDRDLKKTSSKSKSKSSALADVKKATAAAGRKAATKRKAEDSTPAATSSTSTAQNNAKKAKTAAKTKATTPKAKSTTPKIEPDTPKVPKKQTARRGGHTQGPVRGASTTAPPPQAQPARTKQTARRSSAFMARGRIPAPEPAPPSSDGYDYDDDGTDSRDSGEDDSNAYGSNRDNYDSDDSDIPLAALGLLNGGYDVTCKYVESEWNIASDSFSLDLTLEGSSLWGSFDLGIIEGVMFFDERPWQSSHASIPFRWRGRERDGPISYGDNHHGWIKFYGDGRVEGWIDYSSIEFQGDRFQGQGTRGTRSAKSLRDEWNEYSESQYDYESVARWG